MATEQDNPDDGEEAQVLWLLKIGHDTPAMRREFVDGLAQRLDAEFALLDGDGSHAASAAPILNGSLNGSAHFAVDGKGLVDAATAREDAADKVCRPFRRVKRSRRRWVLSIVGAASVALASAIVSNPPAWAAAFRAFVQKIETFATGGAAESANAGVAVGAQPKVAAAPEAPRVARADVPKSSAIAPIAQQGKATEPAAPVPVAPKVYEQPAKKPDDPHREVDKSDWKPFDKPLANEELTRRVDAEMAAQWQKNAIHPVDAASDAEFMRRVYLDLTGRIPTVSEVHDFSDDQSPNRRELLVDRLLVNRDHATHVAALWHAVLLPNEVDLTRIGGTDKFDEWLADRFAANEPYDQIVRELLLAEGRVSESGPLLFYAALKLNPEELAARSSRAFLGVRMECAQCHDHKFDVMTQHDFWSFAAFFARISRPLGKMEMTSPVLAVHDSERGDVAIPNSSEVVPPRLPSADANIQDTPGGPSRRKQLVEWLTSKDNGQFSRAAVNRVWAQLFGRGLVEPVDDMRPVNTPIAPEVLNTLSRDFAASGFDLRRLTRALVLTKTYQLSSQSKDNDPSRSLNFAQMNIKNFTAEQLYDCIAVATQKSKFVGATPNASGLARFGDMTRQAFVDQFRAPTNEVTDYHAGIPQALTMMHGGLIQNATDVGTSGLLGSLSAPFFTDEQRLETLFLSTMSRQPDPAEREAMLKSIAAAKTDADRQKALGDVLWALLNSAEFTFNH
jgi:hypothetical protein